MAVAEARAVTTKGERPIEALLRSEKVQDGFRKVASHNFRLERVVHLVLHAFHKTPKLWECSPKSVLGSLMMAMALDLEPNTPTGQSYLIPFANRRLVNGKWTSVWECQLQIGYRGFITLGYRSKAFRTIHASGVRQRDVFEYEDGPEGFLRFAKRMTPDTNFEADERDNPFIGGYCFTKMLDGFSSHTVLNMRDIARIRSRSQTWTTLLKAVEEAEKKGDDGALAKARTKLAETPWEFWKSAMIAKTCVKQHTKLMPIFEGLTMLAAASALDDAAEGNVIDMEAFADPDAVEAVVHGDEVPTTAAPPSGVALTDETAASSLARDLGRQMAKGPQGEELTIADIGKAAPRQRREERVSRSEPETGPPEEDGDPGPNADESSKTQAVAQPDLEQQQRARGLFGEAE